MSVAQGAIEERRLLLSQARELAATAEQAGANRASVGSQVNAILQQAKEVVAGASVGGKKVFGTGQSEIRVPSAVAGNFGVQLGGSRTVTTTTYTSSAGSSTPVYETRPVYEDRPMYTTVPTYTTQTATGQKEWTRLLAGQRRTAQGMESSWGGDTTSDLATGKDGAIFAVGEVDYAYYGKVSSATFDGQTLKGDDGFLTKYNTDGTIAWSTLIGNGNTGGTFGARGVTVGNDGSVYVVGAVDDAGGTFLTFDDQSTVGNNDAFVTKYNADGSKVWTRVVGSVTGNEVGLDVKVDGSGAVYLAGSVRGTTILDGQTWRGTGNESFVTKFDANGNKAWTRLSGESWFVHIHSDFQGSSEASIGRTQLTLGSDGMVYLAPRNEYVGGGAQALKMDKVFKFDSAGTKQGELIVSGGPTLSTDAMAGAEINGILTGSDGSIYVTGNTAFAQPGNEYLGGSDDAFLTKFNADGTKAWTKQFGGRGADYGVGLTEGTDGKIYVAGTSASSFGGGTNNYDPNNTTSGNYFDAFVTQFDIDGTQGWTKLVGSDRLQQGYSVTTGLDGAIYLGGRTTGNLDGQSIANYFETNPSYRGPQDNGNGRGATFLTKFTPTPTNPNSPIQTGTTQVQTGTNRVQVGTQQVLVGTTTSTTVLQPVTQTRTITSPFNDFTVNLSSTASTTSAIASIDEELKYLDTMSRTVGFGLQRANISRRYLVRN